MICDGQSRPEGACDSAESKPYQRYVFKQVYQQSTTVLLLYSAKGLVHCFLIGKGGGMLCLCSVIQLSLCLA